MKQYHPLYSGIDDKNHSPEPYPTSSSYYTYPTSSKLFNINSPYQDIATYL